MEKAWSPLIAYNRGLGLTLGKNRPYDVIFNYISNIPFSHTLPIKRAGQWHKNRLPVTWQFSRHVPPLKHGWALQHLLKHWVHAWKVRGLGHFLSWEKRRGDQSSLIEYKRGTTKNELPIGGGGVIRIIQSLGGGGRGRVNFIEI